MTDDMDPTLTLTRIRHALESQFKGLIDLQDYAGKPDEEVETAFLTRALAAWSIVALTGVAAKTAAASITDGFKDNGIDAVYFHDEEKTLYFVQSKWSKNATKTISEGDALKFVNGIRATYSLKFDDVNEKLKSRAEELRPIIMRSDVRFALVVAFTGTGTLDDSARRPVDDLLSRENNLEDKEVFSLEVFNHSRIYSFVSGSASHAKIKMQVGLSEWGIVHSPYIAYYGQMKLADIATWADFGKRLLDRNIRFYHGSTEVNDALMGTVLKDPQNFWYFNNGITIICSKIEKTRLNGDSRDYGVFECDGVCVVNGAQTVGVICDIAKKDDTYFKSIEGKVNVRLISLEKCPPGFDEEIAKATNTQNQIKSRDFVSLDKVQHRVAQEMQLDKKRYAFKSGDEDPKPEDGCGLEEAMVALACSMPDPSLAVQAKREVSRLWAKISEPPYTLIFNEKLQASHMWRAVLILRAVEDERMKLDFSKYPDRGELIAVHGNRTILHEVFQDPDVKSFRDPKKSEQAIVESARKATRRIFDNLVPLVNQYYEDAYPANLFKNSKKCEDLSRKLAMVPQKEEEKIANTLF